MHSFGKQLVNSAWALLGFFVTLSPCHAAAPSASTAVQPILGALRPNIVFLLADDLGSADLGVDGGKHISPNLDKLGTTGQRLRQFYVQPVCSPTRAALMTGRYPFRYGLQVGVIRPWAQYGLSLQERMLSVALQEVGYTTAIVGKWHLGHFRPEYLPTKRGFDKQYGHYNGAIDYFTKLRDGGYDWHRNDRESRDEGYATDLLGDEAARIIREHDQVKPLFLYVPFNAVHSPFQAPEEYKRKFPDLKGNNQIYAAMVYAMDLAVGKIVAALDERGMRKQTLIVFSSDNGGYAPGQITNNGSLRAGKGTLYEGGVRSSAIANWPGKLQSGECQAVSHMVDWYPTLLKLAGAKLDQPLPLDGYDIWPCLAERKPTLRSDVVFNITPTEAAIRVGEWKLVQIGAESDVPEIEAQSTKPTELPQAKRRVAQVPKIELFNLNTDPSEKINLADKEPARVKELTARLKGYADKAAAPLSKPIEKGFKSPRVWGESGAAQ